MTLSPSGLMTRIADLKFGTGIRDTVSFVLTSPASLDGAIQGASLEHLAGSYAVNIIGTPFYALSDQSFRFFINSLPAGNYDLSLRPVSGEFFLSAMNYTVDTICPGKNTEVILVIP